MPRFLPTMNYFCMEEMGFDRFDPPLHFVKSIDRDELNRTWSCKGYLVVMVNAGHLHCARQCMHRFPTRWFIPFDRLILWYWSGSVMPFPLEAEDKALLVNFVQQRTGAHVLNCDHGVGYSSQFTVQVQMMSGRVLEAMEGLWAMPHGVRRSLEIRYRIPAERQRFVVGLRELVDNVTLWDQGVRPEDTISLVLSSPHADAGV